MLGEIYVIVRGRSILTYLSLSFERLKNYFSHLATVNQFSKITLIFYHGFFEDFNSLPLHLPPDNPLHLSSRKAKRGGIKNYFQAANICRMPEDDLVK